MIRIILGLYFNLKLLGINVMPVVRWAVIQCW